jgi:hypothetical protein
MSLRCCRVFTSEWRRVRAPSQAVGMGGASLETPPHPAPSRARPPTTWPPAGGAAPPLPPARPARAGANPVGLFGAPRWGQHPAAPAHLGRISGRTITRLPPPRPLVSLRPRGPPGTLGETESGRRQGSVWGWGGNSRRQHQGSGGSERTRGAWRLGTQSSGRHQGAPGPAGSARPALDCGPRAETPPARVRTPAGWWLRVFRASTGAGGSSPPRGYHILTVNQPQLRK